ncbi:MAG: hypothetical protein GC192_02065 [Bacteroidetes bacterium]|nr:hypothetical protein [Bacteroidota bacterium]
MVLIFNKNILYRNCPLLFVFCIFLPHIINAQGSGLPLGSTNYQIIDRLEIKSGKMADFNTALKSFTRGEVVQFAKSVDSISNLSPLDSVDIQSIYMDNNEWVAAPTNNKTIASRTKAVYIKTGEDSLGGIYRLAAPSIIEACLADERYERCKKPIWHYFYQTPANWLEFNKPAFHLRINPMLNFSVAKPNNGKLLFYNQRGVEIRGGVDDKLYFYTNFSDTQARFAGYVDDFISKFKAIPGNGYYKSYKSDYIDSDGARDFINGQAHIGFHITPHIRLEFGHGKNFLGNGYRSMFLSDFSHNYLYLKANWQLGRFNYQNLFAELTAVSAQANPGDNYIPRKYMAAHYLSFKFSETFSVGVFENTIFKRDTSNGNGFELQYLNPVILYRTVEHLLDSEDNVLIGTDFKWNLFRRIRLYGQFILDEFKFKEIKAGDGWWGNKWGIQFGAQTIDLFGIDHLDLRVEYNAARPYTYSHSDLIGANYSHYNQALAHPLGANFREVLSIIRYQPLKKWTVESRFISAKFGEDGTNQNWGGDILLDYDTREMDFGNEIGQGIGTTTNLFGIDISYEIWHNLNLDAHYFYRKKESSLKERNELNSYFGLGIRWNTSMTKMDF